MKANHTPLSLLLPKTGQVASYQTGDDGTYEAGWWRGLLVTDNKNRFITKTLNGDDVVIDLATGLMWPVKVDGLGCWFGLSDTWGEAIIYANNLDFAGFTDWRMPNINELASIIDWSKYNPAIDESIFIGAYAYDYWSSTSYNPTSFYSWVVSFISGQLNIRQKDGNNHLRCVRGGL